MKTISFHKDFTLNNHSFSSVNDLLSYTKHFHKEIYLFLKEWFSTADVIVVQTSGSTGTPKSIFLNKGQMVNSAKATGNFFSAREKTKALLCLSPEYIAGKMMLVRALTLGWHLDMVKPNSTPLKNISSVYDFCAMVPLQLENSLHQLYQIKTLIVGGGIVSNELQVKIQNSECAIFATYGMTETITHIAIKKLNNVSVHPNFYSVLPSVTIYKDDRDCLVINAPKVSKDIVFTNDVVRLISDTQFEWLGRFDNAINSGGIKLHPETIEQKLSKVIKNRFFVAGIPDELYGEKLVLIVEGVEKEIDFSSCNLSKYEFPKNVFFIAQFTETSTGKIQRLKTLEEIGVLFN